MKISKDAVDKFRAWLGVLKLNYPITKDGVVRSNCSRKNRIKIEESYVRFVNDLVSAEIRPLVKYEEKVDITELWIPSDLAEEMFDLFFSVEPMFIFYAPVNIDNYIPEIVDKDVVIFGDEIITPIRKN